MRIQALTLENFRTYERLTLDLTQGDTHLFIGPNGAGKTNLLESISVLSGARSFLGVEDDHVLQWGKSFFRVRGVMKSKEGESSGEVVEEFLPRRRKAYFMNDAPVRLRGFVGTFPTVSFLPQDLDLLTGSPGLRRRFLDRVLCQTSPEYLQHYIAYARCLKQRNALLRRMATFPSPLELTTWDQQMSSHACAITLSRLALIQSLNDMLQIKLNELGLLCDSASIAYQRQSTTQTYEDLIQEFQTLLQNSRERDLQLRTTGVGPHRDDWMIEVSGRPVDTWMSRGEQRVCIVALFLLQAEYMNSVRGERPVILLDDVFSELDALHQQSICEHLRDHQILITSTHPSPTFADGWLTWTVERGIIRSVENAHAMHHISPVPGHQRHHRVLEGT
ncbi:DNA replication/repair protein RecF [Candidatus Peregrinibacteria bacterium]|nr:DNA replication/repair protein RecF [Candidatus Peregrinibacteria bacterium]